MVQWQIYQGYTGIFCTIFTFLVLPTLNRTPFFPKFPLMLYTIVYQEWEQNWEHGSRYIEESHCSPTTRSIRWDMWNSKEPTTGPMESNRVSKLFWIKNLPNEPCTKPAPSLHQARTKPTPSPLFYFFCHVMQKTPNNAFACKINCTH